MAVTRIYCEFENFNDDDYQVIIDDPDYVGAEIQVEAAKDGFRLDWSGKVENPFQPIIGSRLEFTIAVTDTTLTAVELFATDLLSAPESRFTIRINKNGVLWWVGYVLADLSGFDDIDTPYSFTVAATDGLARLKAFDFSDAGEPFGNMTFVEIITECLRRGGLAEYYYNTGDIFLRTAVNWNEAGHASPTANKCPMAHSRIPGDIFAEHKATNGAYEWEFDDCYKVLESVCRHWGARLYYSAGAYRVEQLHERSQDFFFERRFDLDGVFVSATNIGAYDVNVPQTGNNNRLAGGKFSYLPPASVVEVEYEHNTYKNFFPSDSYNFFYGNPLGNTQTINNFDLDSDSVFRVSGTAYIKIRLSEAHTVPWRYILRLNLVVGSDSLDSATYAVSAGGNGTYTVHRYAPTWDDSAFESYEISTPFVTGVNNVFNINFFFDTPTPPPDGDTISLQFIEYGAVDKDGTFQELELITDVLDWRIHDLNFQIHNSNDPNSLIEKVRTYTVNNPDTGNANKVAIKTLFGHAVRKWTRPKIQVSTDASTWTDSTATWDYDVETKNREFGALLAAEYMAALSTPVEVYSGSFHADNIDFHRRVILPGDSAWLFASASFRASENVWAGDLFRAGINLFNFVIGVRDKKGDTPIFGGSGGGATEMAKIPGAWLPELGVAGVSGPADLALTAHAVNYIGSTVAAGTVTELPMEYAVGNNAFLQNDDIFIVDPSESLIIGATVSATAAAGDTSLSINSITTDVPLRKGAYILYGPLNKFTGQGGSSGSLPEGSEGEILRHDADGWASYPGSADGHVLTWRPATGWGSEAPPAGGGGTVTSVALSMPTAIFDVSGSPVTTSGTLTVTLDNQSANQVFAGPSSGAATTPGFRALVSDDIPSLDAAKIGSGTFGIARGGTGLSALGTANQLLRVNAGATALEYFTHSFLTGNQTITLSGDVSGSGATSITATIGTNAVSNAKFRQSAGLSVVGRSANSTGDVADITAANDGEVLRRSGTSVGFGTVATAGIADAAVTYAKIQNVTDARLLGRSAGSAGAVQEITVGSGLSLSGGTLTATGGGVTGSGVTGRVAIWSGTSSLTSDDFPLFFDTSANKLGIGTATPAAYLHIGVPTGTSDEGMRVLGNLSGNLVSTFSNANNANAGANNIVAILTGGASAGDPVVQFGISGAITWSVGLDNSDSDKFKVSTAATPGNSDRLIIDSTGATAIGTTLLSARLNAGGSGTTSASYSFNAYNSSGTTILSVRDDQRVGILTTAPTQELHVNGDVIARQYMNTTAAPTVAFGTGAGTSPVNNSMTGGVNFFTWLFTTGTSPVANGDIATITLNQSFPSTPVVCMTPRSSSAATEWLKFYISGAGGNAFTIKANGTLTASTPYQINFVLGGY